MFLSIPSDFLYSAYHIQAYYKDENGKEKLRDGNGTCFFVRNSNSNICLITNRHVLDPDYKESTGKYKKWELYKIIIKGKKNTKVTNIPNDDVIIELENIQPIFHPNINNDLAVIKDLGNHNDSLNFKVPFAMIANKEIFEKDLRISDFISFPCYPEWFDKSENRPILRSGTISSDPRFRYSDNKIILGDCIAYEAFSSGGASGSPVFALQRGYLGGDIHWPDARGLYLIGINSGHLKSGNNLEPSGLSYMYESTLILELIN